MYFTLQTFFYLFVQGASDVSYTFELICTEAIPKDLIRETTNLEKFDIECICIQKETRNFYFEHLEREETDDEVISSSLIPNVSLSEFREGVFCMKYVVRNLSKKGPREVYVDVPVRAQFDLGYEVFYVPFYDLEFLINLFFYKSYPIIQRVQKLDSKDITILELNQANVFLKKDQKKRKRWSFSGRNVNTSSKHYDQLKHVVPKYKFNNKTKATFNFLLNILEEKDLEDPNLYEEVYKEIDDYINLMNFLFKSCLQPTLILKNHFRHITISKCLVFRLNDIPLCQFYLKKRYELHVIHRKSRIKNVVLTSEFEGGKIVIKGDFLIIEDIAKLVLIIKNLNGLEIYSKEFKEGDLWDLIGQYSSLPTAKLKVYF